METQSRMKIKRRGLSYIFVNWLTPLISTGYKTPLNEKDLWEVEDEMKAQNLQKYSIQFWKDFKLFSDNPSSNNAPSVFWMLATTYGSSFLMTVMFELIAVCFTILSPVVLSQVLQFLHPVPDGPKLFFESGVLLGFLLFGLQLMISICNNVVKSITYSLQMKARSHLVSEIYMKSFRLSGKSRKIFSEGAIVTFSNTDVENIELLFLVGNYIWSAPFQIIMSSVLIANYLNYSVWTPIFMLVLVFIAQSVIWPKAMLYLENFLSSMDDRVTIVREFLYGVKVIKYRSIETVFQKKIQEIRNTQMNALAFHFVWVVFGLAIILSGASLIPTVSLFTFAGLGGQMVDSTIFPALTLLQSFVKILDKISFVMGSFANGIVSLRRLSEYLLAEEINPNDITTKILDVENDNKLAFQAVEAYWKWDAFSPVDNDDDSVVEFNEQSKVKNDDYSLKEDDFSLKGINLNIEKGSLVAIVGSVGSGKSSLLSAIIGEMKKEAGKAIVYGTMAYCPQQPWILTASIRDNILFGSKNDSDRLDSVVQTCSLERDVQDMSDGLNTEIGEKGVNLSGGQKARISLARAIMKDADVYLLDDPLAALDAHVGQSVFEEAIMGSLKTKTVLLTTHQLHLLPYMDKVIVLKDGCVVEAGTFKDLMNIFGGSLSHMMKDYKLDDKNEIQEKNQPAKIDKQIENAEGTKAQIDEERNTGSVSYSIYNAYIKAAGGTPKLVQMIVLMSIQIIFSASTLIWLSWWTIPELNRPIQLSTMDYNWIYLGLGLLSTAVTVLTLWFSFHSAYYAATHYHDQALNGILNAPMSFFDSQPIGRILNRLGADITTVDIEMAMPLVNLQVLTAEILVGFICIAYAFPPIIVQMLIISVIFYFGFQYFQSTYRELKRLSSIMRSPLTSHISESLSGLSSIIAYNNQKSFQQLQYVKMDNSLSPAFLLLNCNVWISIRLEFFAASLTLTLVLLSTTKLISSDNIGLSLTYTISLSMQANFFFLMLSETEAMFNSVERLEYYANGLPKEKTRRLPSDPPLDLWPSSGSINIKDLDICYENRPDYAVIKGLTVDIASGEKIGIVGRTGSGKSTLMTALFRIMEPTNGSILIDGQDISTLGIETLRKGLQMIPQEPILFEGTIRSNLDLESNFTDDQLWDVLDRIGLKDYVKSQSLLLESPVAQNGDNLSVGQRQLISLGSTILKQPKVLIMDEATASLDSEADKKIQTALQTVFTDATVLSIAHRLNTIANFDKIMVLDAGILIEYDTPYNLLERDSVFSELVAATGQANANLIKEIASAHQLSKF
ncbi:P-loop containing nucleoside triphosphate hydrolase protein [Globomyces pollinis-pini]|nr:P-loop containing nucleoside triphosphate hydrolase protein [Globomyces pollinis-pini]